MDLLSLFLPISIIRGTRVRLALHAENQKKCEAAEVVKAETVGIWQPVCLRISYIST
jgi:hypothetical protein